MLKLIKIVLRDNSYAIAITITIAIAVLSLMHITASPKIIPFAYDDKLKHCLAYFVLTCSWFFALDSSNKFAKYSFRMGIAIFLYGILMEFLQHHYTNYRQGDMFDILANSFGIFLAAMGYRRLVKLVKHHIVQL